MSDTPLIGCTPEAIARIEQALSARNWRILRRIETPDRVLDWIAIAPDGVYWLMRAVWAPPGHRIGLAEVQGMLEGLEFLPGWSGWLVVEGAIEATALAIAQERLCVSNIEAIFPHGGH